MALNTTLKIQLSLPKEWLELGPSEVHNCLSCVNNSFCSRAPLASNLRGDDDRLGSDNLEGGGVFLPFARPSMLNPL